MHHLEIEVQKQDSYIAVLDDDGNAVEEVRVWNANNETSRHTTLAPKPAIELTRNYYTIYDTLEHHGVEYSWDPFSEKGREILAE